MLDASCSLTFPDLGPEPVYNITLKSKKLHKATVAYDTTTNEDDKYNSEILSSQSYLKVRCCCCCCVCLERRMYRYPALLQSGSYLTSL